MNWRLAMEIAIGVPLSIVGFYLAMRLGSYAILMSIKQVFKTQSTKENENDEKKRS